ncbi:MAG TPA: glycosyltransferase family 39 protein [Phycisphaerae bacterium]|nr:glycosyltransferase family 39 protein [Phycisphaerae bacterium]
MPPCDNAAVDFVKLQNLQPGGPRTGRAWRRAALVLAVLVPALLVRVYCLAHTENISRDGTLYLHMARMFHTQGARAVAQSFDYHPGYSVVAAAWAGAAGADWPDDWVPCAQYVSTAMSLIALACLYFVARAAFDRRVALLTVLLMGVSHWFILTGCDVRSEAQTAAMVMLSVALGLASAGALRRGSAWSVALAAGAGLAAAAGYLARPEGIVAAGVAAALLLRQRISGRRARVIQLAALAALVAAALACAFPYAAAIGGFTRKKALSDLVVAGGDWRLLAVVGAGDVIGAVRRLLDRSRQAVGAAPAVLAVVCWCAWSAKAAFRRRLASLEVVRPTSDGVVAMFLAAAVMAPLLVGMQLRLGPAYISSRHAMLPALLVAPCAGAGLATLIRWTLALARRLGIKPRPAIATAGWLCAILAVMAIHAFPTLHEGKAIYRRAGLEIRSRLGPGKLVRTDDSRVAFFAAAPTRQFVNESPCWYNLLPKYAGNLDEFVRASLPYDAIAISNRLLEKVRDPDLIDKLPPERFELMRVWEGPRGKDRLWVFRRR